jgi:hypothetical protein
MVQWGQYGEEGNQWHDNGEKVDLLRYFLLVMWAVAGMSMMGILEILEPLEIMEKNRANHRG